MKTKLITATVLALALILPVNGWGADNTGARPKYSSSNENQVQAASKDTGSGQADVVYGYDYGIGLTTSRGVSGVPFTSADQHSAAASVTDAPTSTKTLVVTDLIVSVDTAMSVTFKCETTGTVVLGPLYMPANSTLPLVTRAKLKLATADKKLQVITSVAGNISVTAIYYSE